MEPASEQTTEQESLGATFVQDQGIGDLRSHLTQLFFKYSLPFQKVLVHPDANSTQPKISLIFLKSQHSFRHLSIEGRGVEHNDTLKLKILPNQILQNLITR